MHKITVGLALGLAISRTPASPSASPTVAELAVGASSQWRSSAAEAVGDDTILLQTRAELAPAESLDLDGTREAAGSSEGQQKTHVTAISRLGGGFGGALGGALGGGQLGGGALGGGALGGEFHGAVGGVLGGGARGGAGASAGGVLGGAGAAQGGNAVAGGAGEGGGVLNSGGTSESGGVLGGGGMTGGSSAGAVSDSANPLNTIPFAEHSLYTNVETSQSYRQALINFGDVQYITYFKIGKQLVPGIPDTGSFELVVFGGNCKSCGVSAHYNPYLSSSFTQGLLMSQQAYGSGSCSSTEAYDYVAIGPYALTNQTFWSVEEAQMPILYNAAFEAIIGVGPPETPAADAWNAAENLISNVSDFFEEGIVAPQALREQVTARIKIANEMSSHPPLLGTFGIRGFSVCLGTEPKSDGYLTWNDDEHLKHPELFFRVPVTGHHTWSAQLTNAQLAVPQHGDDWEGFLGCVDGCSVIMDSGTSLLAVPSFVADRLRRVVTDLNMDCSNIQDLPDLVFELGGFQFSLPSDSYVAQVDADVPDYLSDFVKVDVVTNTTTCQLLVVESIASTKEGPLWILGVPFFRQYYTTFDLGASLDERAFYVSPASPDCSPAGGPGGQIKSIVRTFETGRIYLPETAQRAATQEYVDL